MARITRIYKATEWTDIFFKTTNYTNLKDNGVDGEVESEWQEGLTRRSHLAVDLLVHPLSYNDSPIEKPFTGRVIYWTTMAYGEGFRWGDARVVGETMRGIDGITPFTNSSNHFFDAMSGLLTIVSGLLNSVSGLVMIVSGLLIGITHWVNTKMHGVNAKTCDVTLTSHIIHHTSSITHRTSNPSPYLVVSLHVSRLVKGFVAQQFLLYYNKNAAISDCILV